MATCTSTGWPHPDDTVHPHPARPEATTSARSSRTTKRSLYHSAGFGSEATTSARSGTTTKRSLYHSAGFGSEATTGARSGTTTKRSLYHSGGLRFRGELRTVRGWGTWTCRGGRVKIPAVNAWPPAQALEGPSQHQLGSRLCLAPRRRRLRRAHRRTVECRQPRADRSVDQAFVAP